MMGFAIAATLMVGVTLLLLLLPFRRRHPANAASAEHSRQQLNSAIYRDQIAELESDRAEGSLSQEDYTLAYSELQRRLLEDSHGETGARAGGGAPVPTRTVPIALALALPLGAVLLYLALGNPAALNPPPPEQRMTPDDIERMVSGLAAKLEKEPDNLKGWAMLARSYKAMGRLPEAVRAFEHAGSIVDGDPDLLLNYADALATVNGFNGKVGNLIDKALKLDPTNAQGLWMRGTAAFEMQQYAKAAADWEILLAMLQPGSDDARIVTANIEEARQKGGLAPATQKLGAGGTAPVRPASNTGTAAAANAFVKGRIELSPALAGKAAATDALMVIARPTDGSRMPVAVLRVKANALPMAFTLDDSLSMSPDRKLSSFAELLVEARISRTAQAMPQSGDLISAVQTVKVGADNIRLVVDQVRQ